jgi:predicted small secreted protein
VKTTHTAAIRVPFNRIAFLAFASTIFALVTASCGTVSGFGRDVETVGESIEETAR